MKRIFKKNQIIITALALMIAAAGYINYSDAIKSKKDSKSKEVISNDVDPDPVNENETGEMIFTSITTSDFIISAKLEREQVRASNKELLLEVINNDNIGEADKAVASAKMINLTESSQKEAAAELMLEAKGFNNAIVSILDDKVDVVVDKEELTDTDLAQIEDIVKRKTSVNVENITITNASGNL